MIAVVAEIIPAQRQTKEPERPGVVGMKRIRHSTGLGLYTTEKVGRSCKHTLSSQEGCWVGRDNHSAGIVLSLPPISSVDV